MKIHKEKQISSCFILLPKPNRQQFPPDLRSATRPQRHRAVERRLRCVTSCVSRLDRPTSGALPVVLGRRMDRSTRWCLEKTDGKSGPGKDGWLVVWTIFYFPIFSHILGISSSQLTFIFFRGVAQPPTRWWFFLEGEYWLGNMI